MRVQKGDQIMWLNNSHSLLFCSILLLFILYLFYFSTVQKTPAVDTVNKLYNLLYTVSNLIVVSV